MITSKLNNYFLKIFDEHIPYLTDLLEIDGVYLAGGLLRALFSQDEELDPRKTDVDLFFRDTESLKKTQEFLKNQTPYYCFYQCPEGKLASYVYLDGEEPNWKIQLVTVSFYPTIEEVIDSFDFTVTGFGTDGETLIMLDTAVRDTLEKHLVWHKITYPASSLRRMMKYARKGYWMKEKDYQIFVARVWEHDIDIRDEVLVYVD